jgi:hypothetical protein
LVNRVFTFRAHRRRNVEGQQGRGVMSWARLCVGLGLLVSSAAFAADMPGTLPPPGVAPLLPAPTSSLGW